MLKVFSVILSFLFLNLMVLCLFKQIGVQGIFDASDAMMIFVVVVVAWLFGFGCGKFKI